MENEHGQECVDRLEQERTGHEHQWVQEEVRWCYQCNDIALGTCSRFGPHRDVRAYEQIRLCRGCGRRQMQDGSEWITVSSGSGDPAYADNKD